MRQVIKCHREAFIAAGGSSSLADGTYELIGPKVQGNPEQWPDHRLVKHGCITLDDAPRTFEGLCDYLSSGRIEGVVWHHTDGRMVKIKGKDFGFKRTKR